MVLSSEDVTPFQALIHPDTRIRDTVRLSEAPSATDPSGQSTILDCAAFDQPLAFAGEGGYRAVAFIKTTRIAIDRALEPGTYMVRSGPNDTSLVRADGSVALAGPILQRTALASTEKGKASVGRLGCAVYYARDKLIFGPGAQSVLTGPEEEQVTRDALAATDTLRSANQLRPEERVDLSQAFVGSFQRGQALIVPAAVPSTLGEGSFLGIVSVRATEGLDLEYLDRRPFALGPGAYVFRLGGENTATITGVDGARISAYAIIWEPLSPSIVPSGAIGCIHFCGCHIGC